MITRAAVFDMDGTIVDSETLAFEAALEGLTEFWRRRGRTAPLPTRAELRALIGLPSLEYFAGLVPAEFADGASEVRALVTGAEVRRLAAGEGRLFEGARAALAALRAGGWRLALVSNCGRIYFDANLEHLGLRPLFDVALCLGDGPTKTENVRRALGGAGGVMFGDRAGDIEAGRANGLCTVGCTYGFGTREELRGADRLAHAPSEWIEAIG